MGKKINGEIEWLRFVFAIAVVLVHARNLFGEEWTYFRKASFGVEFFFIVTGFLLAKSINKINENGYPKFNQRNITVYLEKNIGVLFGTNFSGSCWISVYIFYYKTFYERGIFDFGSKYPICFFSFVCNRILDN